LTEGLAINHHSWNIDKVLDVKEKIEPFILRGGTEKSYFLLNYFII
jgi:hypothetical protein